MARILSSLSLSLKKFFGPHHLNGNFSPDEFSTENVQHTKNEHTAHTANSKTQGTNIFVPINECSN